MYRERDRAADSEQAPDAEIEKLPSSPFAAALETVFERASTAEGKQWHRGELLDGRYELHQAIRQASLTQLFSATQVAIQRHVVIEVLRPEWAHDPQLRQELERATLALAAIDHPSVVRVLDLTLTDAPSVVLEHVEGRSLAALIAEEGPLEPVRAVRLALQLCEALRAIHSRGLIHRDIRPANVIVCRRPDGGETARLIGFVLAETPDAGWDGAIGLDDASYAEFACTTEQRATARSDVYALARLLRTMLTGSGDGSRWRDTLDAQLRQTLHRAQAELLGKLVGRGVTRAPVARFQSADQLEEALRNVLIAPSPHAPPARPRSARLVVAVCVVVIAAMVLAGMVGFLCARLRVTVG